MAGGHRQQSTKRLLEEMMVGDCDGIGNSNCNGNNDGDSDSIDNDADADAMVVCVVCVLREFWQESLPPENKSVHPLLTLHKQVGIVHCGSHHIRAGYATGC